MRKFNLFICFAALFLSGCAQVINYYEGPKLPDTEVAKLFCRSSGSEIYIDGEKLDYNTSELGLTIKLKPKIYTIFYSWKPSNMTCSFTNTMRLDAKANHDYRLLNYEELGEYLYDNTFSVKKAHVCIVDIKSRKPSFLEKLFVALLPLGSWYTDIYKYEFTIVAGTAPPQIIEYMKRKNHSTFSNQIMLLDGY